MTSLVASPARLAPAELKGSRRDLQFETLADILTEVESLASDPVTTLGQWTAAQNIDHVRRLVRVSHAGADFSMPWFLRLLGRLIKSKVLRSAVKPGMKTVAAFQPPAEITMDEALAAFRDEIRIASQLGVMCQPSPFLGKMTHEEWEQLHCRHAEHHLGYIVQMGDS